MNLKAKDFDVIKAPICGQHLIDENGNLYAIEVNERVRTFAADYALIVFTYDEFTLAILCPNGGIPTIGHFDKYSKPTLHDVYTYIIAQVEGDETGTPIFISKYKINSYEDVMGKYTMLDDKPSQSKLRFMYVEDKTSTPVTRINGVIFSVPDGRVLFSAYFGDDVYLLTEANKCYKITSDLVYEDTFTHGDLVVENNIPKTITDDMRLIDMELGQSTSKLIHTSLENFLFLDGLIKHVYGLQ